MLTRLVNLALKNRVYTFLFFTLIALFGLFASTRLPIDAVPDITNVQVVINTKTGALDPSKIEKLVSYPIEAEMSGIQGVTEVRSLSKYGLSQVVIVFEDHTPIYFARQLISEKLQGVRSGMPDGVSPELAPVTTGLGEVLMYTIEAKPGSPLAALSEKERLLRTREAQEYIVRPQLKKIAGVADVDTNGGLLKQIHLNFRPEKLAQYGLSLEAFISKLDTLGESFGGGYIQQKGNQVIVRATGQIETLDAIANLPLSLNTGGRLIRIRDVAEVRADSALRVGAATAHGEETVLGTVLMRVGANSRTVSMLSEEALKSHINLPEDIQVRVLYSRSHLVNATIHTILKSLLEGAALVILILILLLGNFRAALVVATAIPIAMLFALKGMEVFGISANLMSLGAIDFGLLVDGAVVLIENVIRRFEDLRGRAISKEEKFSIVRDASREVLKPVVFGLFIIMLVYIPILYLEGIEGKMFRPMAATVLLALIGSLLVALFLMPAMAYLFIPVQSTEHKEPKLYTFIHKLYLPLLNYSLPRKWIVLAITVVPALVAFFIFKNLGSDFVPKLDEGDLVINLTRPRDQGIDESVKLQKAAENIVAEFPEVETVFSRMGTPESALDPMGPYLADTFVILKKDKKDWPKVNGHRRTKIDLFEAIKQRLKAANPNQEISANQPIEMRFNEILEGSRADVSLRIYGPDLNELLAYTEAAEKSLQSVKGVSSLESDPLTALAKGKMLDVILNYERMASYGISLHDVNSILESAMSGREVGSFYDNDRRFPVLIHLDESLRDDVAKIAQIPVGLKDGGTVPLSQVATIKEKEQITTIARSGARRYSALSIFLKDRDITSFVTEAKAVVSQAVKLKPGYEFSWGGQFKNLEKARARLLIVIPFTLLAIFLLLLKNFGSLRHALLVFSAIPFAAVGGVFSLYLRGIDFSISASIGFIALTGIATLNSIVMVSAFNHLRDEGKSIFEAVHQGALSRLRPVAMTALVASLGFLPMALNTGVGAEVQRPLATVVIGGLLTSTLLTLIVVPALYQWIERRFEKS